MLYSAVRYISQGSVLRCFSLAFLVFMGQYTLWGQDRLYQEFFYPDGVLSSHGYFENGQPDGFWENFYPSGKLKSAGKRTNNELDSIWKFYDGNGCLSSEINYLNGKKNGYYFTYETLSKNDSVFPVLVSKELYLNDVKQGKSYYYHFSGYQKEIAPFENGKKHGTVFYFDSTGLVTAYANFIRGVQLSYQNINKTDTTGNKIGIWKEFHTNGEVKSEQVYDNGTLSGYTKRFNRNGQLMSAQLFQKDSLISDSVTDLSFLEPVEVLTYFQNGQPKIRGLFKDSIPVGIHRVYDSLGTILSTIIYRQNGTIESRGIFTDKGERIGKWEYFYETGNIYKSGYYRNNAEYGEWKFFYPNGQIREIGNYTNGAFSGTWTFYHINGTILRVLEYFDGLEEGLCTEYNDSSQVIAEGMYLAGLREGQWIIKSGALTMSGNFRLGERTGFWKYVYNSGNDRFTGEYKLGNPHGKHRYYYEDGTMEREEIWRSGRKDKVWKFYNPDGSLDMQIFYKKGKELQIVHID